MGLSKCWENKTIQQNTKPFSYPSSGFCFILQEEALAEASLTMSHFTQEPGASLGTHIFCFLSSWTKDWEDLFLLHLKLMDRRTGQGCDPGYVKEYAVFPLITRIGSAHLHVTCWVFTNTGGTKALMITVIF